jgi:hypothetical protein
MVELNKIFLGRNGFRLKSSSHSIKHRGEREREREREREDNTRLMAFSRRVLRCALRMNRNNIDRYIRVVEN